MNYHIIYRNITLLLGIIVVNDPVVNSANFTLNEWLLTSKPGLFGLINGWANPTGVALLVILCIIFFCSQAFVRRSGFFEVNKYITKLFSHRLIFSFVDILLHSLDVYSFLGFINFTWPKLLEMVYRTGSYLRSGTSLSNIFCDWEGKNLYKLWSFITF